MRKLGGERSESKFCLPQIVLHHSLSQRLGVVRDPPLQCLKPGFGIEQGDTYRDLAEVRSAEEPEGRLLGIMLLVPACFCFGDDPLKVFEAAIDEIDALPADCQPCSTVYPRAPSVKAGDHRSGGVIDCLGQLTNAVDREGSFFRVENVEIEVRPWLSASAGMRST